MPGLRVLITNNTLAARAGSELYVRDLAVALLARGHRPVAYSTELGGVADELRRATVPVIDNLDRLAEPPDLIHGHHHLDTMTALLHFPGVPAVYVCHGWLPWQEAPPLAPAIRRYLAVDQVCWERLVCEHGIPPQQVQLVLNCVDLSRFQPRPPLPLRPRRALVFSNSACEATFLPAVRSACERAGVSCDVMGAAAGTDSARPEETLLPYDLVFAKGRSALEALAVGTAVVLCDAVGCGPLVTAAEYDRLRALNFGVRTLRQPVRPETLRQQIDRYDATDAARVSRRLRAEAGLDAAVGLLEDIYTQVIAEHRQTPADGSAERHAGAVYLRGLAAHLKRLDRLQADCVHFTAENAGLRQENAGLRQEIAGLRQEIAERTEQLDACDRLRRDNGTLRAERDALAASTAVRLVRRIGRLPVVGGLARSAATLARRRAA